MIVIDKKGAFVANSPEPIEGYFYVLEAWEGALNQPKYVDFKVSRAKEAKGMAYGGRWVEDGTADIDWPALIAERRWQAEVAGIDIAGIHVETDDRSKLLINGAALEALIDPQYVMQWKTPGGFVDMDATQVLAVARAVRAHVQGCFDREAELLAAVADGSINAEMLAEGWPG